MDLYHADIRLPVGFHLPARVVPLHWTRHAEGARFNDRYGVVPHLNSVNLAVAQTIEVGLEGRRVQKVVVRVFHPESFDLDIVLVLIPGPVHWTVKTVWLNERNDTHKTLDRSKYVC